MVFRPSGNSDLENGNCWFSGIVTDCYSAEQDIPCQLRNSRVHYSDRRSSPLSQLNPVNVFAAYCLTQCTEHTVIQQRTRFVFGGIWFESRRLTCCPDCACRGTVVALKMNEDAVTHCRVLSNSFTPFVTNFSFYYIFYKFCS